MEACTSRWALPARAWIGICLAVAGGYGNSLLWGQQPGLPGARLHWVYPAGARQGATVEVAIGGADLDDVAKLVFSDPGISAVQKMAEPGLGQTGPQPVPEQFTVTLKPEVPPGIYEVRAAGKYGLSNPRAFFVSAQPEALEAEPNNRPAEATAVELGAIVHGRSGNGADVDYFKFTAQQGQRLIVDCWGYRLDSRMDPTLVLYDAQGRELARSRDVNRRDPLLDVPIPATGEYLVQVYDFTYGGGADFVYRLAVGVGPYVDFAFPPSAPAGTRSTVTLYGRNLPGGQPAPHVVVDGRPLEMVSVAVDLPADPLAVNRSEGITVEPVEAGEDAIQFRLPAPQGPANAVPIFFAAAPLVLEQEPNDQGDKAQRVTLPAELAGQFYPRGDRDWVTFDATQGQELWIEVHSQQLGLPTDPLLVLYQVQKNEQGVETLQELQAVDDAGGQPNRFVFDPAQEDPALRFVAPADGTYRLLVRDQYNGSRADPRHVYRLVIGPPRPDFRLVASPVFPPNNPDPNQNQPSVWSPQLRKGGAEMIEVVALRRQGFDGEIQVTVAGLPAGVTASPLTIGPGQRRGTLVLTAADGAPEATAAVAITGKASLQGAEVTRPARLATMAWGGQPNQTAPRWRLARELNLAVSGPETAPFALDAGQNTVLEMCRAGKVKFPVKVVRRGEFKGNVALAAAGLPPNVQPQNTNFDANKADGEFELNLQGNAPLGTFTFHLLGTSQVNYARNPEAAQAATARKEAIDKLAAEAAEAARKAAEAKGAAERKANELKAAAQQAAEAQRAATQAATDAQNAANTAAQQAQAAKEAAEKNTADANLAAARDAALKAAEEAAAKAKTAADARATAERAAADAESASQKAAEEKTAADKLAADADAQSKQVAQFQQNFNQTVNDLVNRAKPQPYNVGAPSTTVTLKITPAPITLAPGTPAATVKQQGKIEVPLTITRLYNYNDPVPVRPMLPGGVGGLNIPQVTIPQGQNQVLLVIEANASATPGTHKLTLQGVPRLNNQELQVPAELALTVEKTEPPKP